MRSPVCRSREAINASALIEIAISEAQQARTPGEDACAGNLGAQASPPALMGRRRSVNA
jgi:hypothetical protein